MSISTTVTTFDSRRFFDKAFVYGVQHGIISAERQTMIQADLAKGMVQIANYFGTAYLRPDLELAIIRITNLISIYLEDHAQGDVQVAAQSLQNNSLLSHSKQGADMLRRLHSQPKETLLLQYGAASTEEQQSFLNEMSRESQISWPEYKAELARGQAIQNLLDLGFWLAKKLKLASEEICDAEQLINTAMLLILAPKAAMKLPKRSEFDTLLKAVKPKKVSENPERFALFFSDAPTKIEQIAQTEMDRFIAQEWPKIRSNQLNLAHYYLHGGIDAISDYDAAIAKNWQRISHNDDNSVIATLFLLVATGQPVKSAMLKREASAMVQALRENGLNNAAVIEFIEQHVPVELREELTDFWLNDLKEDADTALANKDPEFPDLYMERAFKYLQNNCNTTWKGRS
ncbi:hypothetical protein [uncultured Deefgea sp.]|uniref:hypothetical protein n=1 Tax=uncultured Deefgea sp. TaxID=1304914 RepID=UPI00259565DC|nr:hypothetical protein [uncultured Deefgea sp.]